MTVSGYSSYNYLHSAVWGLLWEQSRNGRGNNMVEPFDREKAEKLLNDYPSEAWDTDTRRAFLGELETCYVEDSRLSAIKNVVDEEINTVGLYNGTILWSIYGILQKGLPIGGILPVEVAPVAGKTTDNSVVVTVQGVPAILTTEEAQALIDTLQTTIVDSTDKAEDRKAELKKVTKRKD